MPVSVVHHVRLFSETRACCRSCGGLEQLWQADEIVAGHRQDEFESELWTPRSMGRARPPMVLPQPNDSSMRFLICWLTA